MNEVNTVERPVMRVRINIGATVSQDHTYGIWPWNAAAHQVDPAMVFDAEYRGHYWECRADGYGYRRWIGESGDYGNGSIHVFGKDPITVLGDTS